MNREAREAAAQRVRDAMIINYQEVDHGREIQLIASATLRVDLFIDKKLLELAPSRAVFMKEEEEVLREGLIYSLVNTVLGEPK